MTILEIALIIVVWIFSLIFAFLFGGVVGIEGKDVIRKNMVCSVCGHKGEKP
jgi:hypothetical protein